MSGVQAIIKEHSTADRSDAPEVARLAEARRTGRYALHEVYEPEVTDVMRRFIRAGDVAVDAGASIGYFTRLISELVGPKGLVLAFEPDTESFGYLMRNIREHIKEPNVRAFRTALWKVDGALRLWSTDKIGYTSVCHYYTAVGHEDVEARTLDSLLPEEIHVDFLKIDCELAEYEVLLGAKEILRRGVDCVVLEFNYYLMKQIGMSDHLIRDFMADLGYDMFLISMGKEYDRPVRVQPEVEIIIEGNLSTMNVMFSTEARVRSLWTTT